MIKIDKRSDRPIFKQIYDGFFHLIENGELKAGDPIPSERDLCEDLNISRMTLRNAMNQLVGDGLLVRKHGTNTFVSATLIDKNAIGFLSFSEDMHTRNMTASSKVNHIKEIEADYLIADQLDIPYGASVIYLERVRLANNEPMALEKVHLASARFPGLLDYDLKIQSLYEILEKDFNCYPAIAEETISSIILNEEEAQMIGEEENCSALLVKRITRDENGKTVEAVNTIYRADRYRIRLIRRRSEIQ